jgi:hypothetical protein
MSRPGNTLTLISSVTEGEPQAAIVILNLDGPDKALR